MKRFFSVLILLAACDDGNPAEAQCRQFTQVYCEQVATCFESPSLEDCLASVDETCSEASETLDNFQACVGDVEAATCEELWPTGMLGQPTFPASCPAE